MALESRCIVWGPQNHPTKDARQISVSARVARVQLMVDIGVLLVISLNTKVCVKGLDIEFRELLKT